MDIANPSEEHAMLRSMIRDWVEECVEPQAFEHDKKELFNLELLRSMGELGLLGISAPEEYGGAVQGAVGGVRFALLMSLSGLSDERTK